MPAKPQTRRRSITLPGLAALGLVTSLFATTGAQADGEPLQLDFGVYSSNKPSAMVRVFKPTLKQIEASMSEQLGREVDIRMQIAKDYDEGITDLTSGQVDFSRFGPASYVEARRLNRELQILAMESIENSRVFYGIIAVHADSDIETLEQLRGRSFAFGDEGSTIGRFLSQLHLEQNDIRAGDLERYDYLGRHDKVGTAVGAGGYDAGALNEKTFKKLVEAGEPIRELARFSNVTKPWIARSDLEPEIVVALRTALLQLTDEKALATLKVDGFLESGDTDYERIRMAMEENDRFFAEREAEQLIDAQMDATVTVEQSDDLLRLGIAVPAELFEHLAGSEAPRVLIELRQGDGAPPVAAALPVTDAGEVAPSVTGDASGADVPAAAAPPAVPVSTDR